MPKGKLLKGHVFLKSHELNLGVRGLRTPQVAERLDWVPTEA